MEKTCEKICCRLIPIAFWLGVAAFVVAAVLAVAGRPFLFHLTPGGILRGGEVLLLITVAGFCVHRTAHGQ